MIKYEDILFSGSREKCDRNIGWTKGEKNTVNQLIFGPIHSYLISRFSDLLDEVK